MNDHASEPLPCDMTPPPEVPDFDLIRVIGEGGFGRVWLARSQTTGRFRAVKVIPLRGAAGGDPAGREISSITRLEANVGRQHPNLLTIHHVGRSAEHLFYVMDLADNAGGGEAKTIADYRPLSLQSRLEDGPLSAEQCLRCARGLLAGLAFLHDSRMVHRDVKPANCLFVDGELKLADFGLLTEVGPQVSRVGTRAYMPPDGRMDARADVYAAGLVIYEMVSGLSADSYPRPGDRARQSVADPQLAALMRLALQACEPDPQRRYADARVMLSELARLLSDANTRRRAASRRVTAVAAGLAVALAIAAAGFCYWAARPRRVHVNFVTHPFEATILLDGELQVDGKGTLCKTPCTIEDLPVDAYNIVFRREGLDDLVVGRMDFANNRRIEADWNAEQ